MILPQPLVRTLLAAAILIFAAVAFPVWIPAQSGAMPTSGLVELVGLDSTIHLDIRYATSGNFMKRPMYSQARAFLQRPAADAVVRVHQRLRAQGYGLLVLDGYRPWSVTKKFWDETPPSKRAFVADPKKGSRHNRGCAVDLTLYDLSTGKEVAMPSPYDDFTVKASPTYAGGTVQERRARDLLRDVMKAEGFTVEPNEWWHFDFRAWRAYPVLDIPFEKLNGGVPGKGHGGNENHPLEISVPFKEDHRFH